MVEANSTKPTGDAVELQYDDGVYNPSAAYDSVFGPSEIAWFKAVTGIQDDEELKKHVLAVQDEAWKIFPYRCLRALTFAKKAISVLPAYPHVLKLGKERKGAILLDYACCFGNDLRTAIADGFPADQTIASDFHAEFWNLGHKLFRSTPDSFPAHFIPSDVLNLSFSDPVYEAPSTPVPQPLSSLTSLEPLVGHVSAIHVSAMFHLFDEEKQRRAARSLGSLLSPVPGSIIFGLHIGSEVSKTTFMPRGETSWNPSPEDWREVWDGYVFKKGTVKVDVKLVDRRELSVTASNKTMTTEEQKLIHYILLWSVTRV